MRSLNWRVASINSHYKHILHRVLAQTQLPPYPPCPLVGFHAGLVRQGCQLAERAVLESLSSLVWTDSLCAISKTLSPSLWSRGEDPARKKTPPWGAQLRLLSGDIGRLWYWKWHGLGKTANPLEQIQKSVMNNGSIACISCDFVVWGLGYWVSGLRVEG